MKKSKTPQASPRSFERQEPKTSPEATRAKRALAPHIQAALTLVDYNANFGQICMQTLVTELRNQCEMVNDGNLARPESILISQAHTLDSMFNRLARKATTGDLQQLDVHLRLALKAQSQCRTTLETLAAIKNPAPVAFVRQANISQGPQQVNNGSDTPTQLARARETKSQQDKLLEDKSGECLDTGTTSATGRAHPQLATVGAIHGASHRRG